MQDQIVPENVLADKGYWKDRATTFVETRMGLAGAMAHEFIAGYVDAFLPVYATPKKRGSLWYAWFILPGRGRADRIVTQLLPGTYIDHEGTIFEHDPEWVMILGYVTRKGDKPLLDPQTFLGR